MKFLWHHALWLLFVLPALAGAYLVSLRRRNQAAQRYASLGLPREPGTVAGFLKPHLSALLLFAGLTLLLLSVARPVLVITSPAQQGTVVLLIDVSLSMAATDVPPTRLEAARVAAKEFVKAQPPDVRIGVVAFGGHADVVQLPTLNRPDVMGALDRLELQRFTAIGNGLIGALLTIVPNAEFPQGYDIFGTGRSPVTHEGVLNHKHADGSAQKAAAPGSFLSAAIILVSDGKGTIGVPAAKAAKMAADLGIRVHTVGVGSLYGGVANVEGWPPIHAEFSEETLQEIADITHGEYFLARSADKVAKIYEGLGRRIVLERTDFELTVLCAVLGMLLSIAAAALSLLAPSRPAWS